ncbi:DUF1351 domain-containing protein [Lachnospiraceae bacterium 38-14]
MADELSLVIENPHEGEFLKHIDWNKEEFMELVASITEQYEGLTYTEDQMKSAKADRAKLNAMKKAISDRRIQVKKAVMEPYTKFEAEVSEVTALIDKPIAMIDGQIKEYEDRTKEEKKAALKTHFEEIAADLEGILTFDRVFDQRYLNVSVSLNKAKADIQEKVDRVHTDLRSLEGFCEEKYLTIAKDAYIRTLNVSDALAEARRLQEFDRKAEEERLRREEEAKEVAVKAAETQTAESVTETPENVTKEAENVTEPAKSVSEPIENVTEQAEVIPPAAPVGSSIDTPDTSAGSKKAMEADSKPCKASFTVYGTKAQIMALREYMVQHNIKFGKVEK